MFLLWVTFCSLLSSQEAYSEGCWGDKSSMAEMLNVHGYLYSTRPVAATMHLHTAAVFLGTKIRFIRFFNLHKLYVRLWHSSSELNSVGKVLRKNQMEALSLYIRYFCLKFFSIQMADRTSKTFSIWQCKRENAW